MSTAISAASDGQQRRLADALRLNFANDGAARPEDACPRAGRAAPTAVAVSTHADAGPPLQAEPGLADYPPSSSRPEDTCPRAGRAAPTAVAVSTHADAGPPLQAEPGPADYPPSSSRPEDTCPRAGRAAPTAVAVSTHADAGPPLQVRRPRSSGPRAGPAQPAHAELLAELPGAALSSPPLPGA